MNTAYPDYSRQWMATRRAADTYPPSTNQRVEASIAAPAGRDA
jgi:hypothetical protein